MRHYLIALGIPALLFTLAALAGTPAELVASNAPVVNLGDIFGHL